MIFIVIPVKELNQAKERLSGFLNPKERRMLVYAMLQDVMRSVLDSVTPSRKFIITKDDKAAELADSLGFELIEESEQLSESQSVDRASLSCMDMGAESVLRLPGDIPLVMPQEIDSVLKSANLTPSIAMVPSRDHTGTNAMLRTPPNVIKSQFGPGSLRKHIQDAEELGIPYDVFNLPGIGQDIDDSMDLRRLVYKLKSLASGIENQEIENQGLKTIEALCELGLFERIDSMKLTG